MFGIVRKNTNEKAKPEITVAKYITVRIAEDTMITELANALKNAEKAAMDKKDSIELRKVQLMDRLIKQDYIIKPASSFEIDEIENAALSQETKESIEKRYIALSKASNRCWTWDQEYRKAMVQYLSYIKPLLTDLETEMKKMGRQTKYLHAIDDLLRPAGLIGQYDYNYSFEKDFGRYERADDFVDSHINQYKRPTPALYE